MVITLDNRLPIVELEVSGHQTAVFCCFATKAARFELVSDLFTDAFIGALWDLSQEEDIVRRFTAKMRQILLVLRINLQSLMIQFIIKT